MKGTTARKPARTGERELVLETVSEATGVRFEIVAPHPAFPLPVDRIEWFMRCRDREGIEKAPYLNAAWKEKEGTVFLESLAVGDTVDWIDLAYGEEQAGKSLDIDYSRLEDPEFREEFSTRFPVVMDRIKEYEEAVAGVAKKTGTRLEIRRAGSKGILIFTIAARVKPRKGASESWLRSAITKSASALKEAYARVQKP